MTEANLRQLMACIGEKLPQEKILYLKNALVEAPDDKVDELLCTQLHNPTHMLLYSIFLGGLGIDRFILGDTGLGIAKLLFNWATCGIWSIIDIFITHKRAKEKNFNKIMMLL